MTAHVGPPPIRTCWPTPSIAIAHAYVSGAGLSDSERTLAIGGADQVDPAVLDGFDYVALGHLHRPQRIGGTDTVAYSGSPIPYSVSEDHPKSVRLLDVTGGRIGDITIVPVPVGRKVVTLTGTLQGLLTDPAHERYTDRWVAARLADDTVQTQPMERLRSRFPHAVSLRYDNPATGAIVDFGTVGPPIEERSDEDVILQFLEEVRDRPPSGSERGLVLNALATALREGQP
jgi:exonuclease SbcD